MYCTFQVAKRVSFKCSHYKKSVVMNMLISLIHPFHSVCIYQNIVLYPTNIHNN
jgi:hypothetical protein